MRLRAVPCPCGCAKWLVEPLFHSVDATLYKEEADQLVQRWNHFERDIGPVGCDDQGPLYKDDLDADALRDGRLKRRVP